MKSQRVASDKLAAPRGLRVYMVCAVEEKRLGGQRYCSTGQYYLWRRKL